MSLLRSRVRRAGRVAVAALLALAVLPVVLLSSDRPALAGPPPVFTIFVPFDEASIDQALWSILTTFGSSGNQITTQITVTIAADDTVLYWDHWEDGYESDIANAGPTSTTETWGDQDVSNGAAPGVTLDADDVLDGGDVVTLQNDVPLPRDSANLFFDGRDKVAATRGIVLTRAGWDTALGTVHAGAVAASNLSQFGTQFDIPVGENIFSNEAFEYTSVSVQASDDDTFVELDIDGDGDVDQSTTIDAGETWFVDGGVNAGARVETSKPSQVHLITGDVGSTVSGRWYEVFPDEILDSEYVAAAQTTNAGNPVSVFVHNTNDTAITVAVDAVGTANDTNLSIPQRGTISYTLPDGSGARFSSSDGNFSAISATVALAGNTTAFDWGYTLVPATSLTSGVIVGWGDGSQVAGRNDSPVWIAPLDATDLEIDFDNDGTVDQTIVGVQQYESVKIVDTTDFDMTGARILSPTGVRLSAAWGQDPDVADTVTAYDLGTAVLPSTSLIVAKTAELATDQNSDGRVNPGDSLRYEITAADAGSLPLNNVVAVDDLPSTLTYVPGTATVDGSPIADDTVGATPFPFDETGYDLGTLNPGARVIATFEAALVDPFPLFTTTVRNTVVLTTAEGDTTQATSIVPVVIPDLYLAKTNDLTAPALPGQTFTYSMAVGNLDTSAQTGVTVSDPLPPEVTWVSTSVTRPVDDTAPGATKQASDDFSTVSYGNDAADWDGDWTETETGGAGPSAGDVTITSDLGSNRLQLAGDAVAVQRTVDTSGYGRVEVSFDWRRVGFEADDLVRFEVSNTGGTTFIEVDRFEGTADDPIFTSETYDLTNFGGGDLTLRWTTSAGFDGAGDRFQLDDVSVDLTRRIDETVVGGAPPALYSGGELLAGESLTVDVTVTVDPSIDPSIDDFENTAAASSTQSPGAVQSTSTVEVARASVGDTVWHDQDGDGVVDVGEPRLSGVTVELRDGGNTVIGSDVTDASGQYLFDDLDPGDYTVTVIAGVPAGMVATDDADGGRDETTDVTLGFGTVDDTVDFGYATPVTVGDRVFADIDGDGVENGVDFGVDALDVTITGTSPNSSHQGGSTTSTTAGSYSFANLLPGTYTLTVDTTPLSTAAYATTTANGQTGDTQTITVVSGADDLTGDFGYVLPAAIGDLVWHDLDADGVRDAGEPAMAGVTVTATGPGLPIGGVDRTTDANGYYLFANLDAGTFTISVTDGTGDLPAGYDSSTGGSAQSATVASDDVIDTVDFGFYTQGSIGDLVFEDVNGNGVYDSGLDSPLDAVDVTITGTSPGASHPGGTTQATAGGAYDFTGLEPGTYTLTVDTSGFPAGTVNTLNGASPSVTVRSTDDVDTADFGFLFPASIGDFVWHDLDGDGLYDSGTEPGLSGVELTLTGGALPPAGVTATTDASGAYAFSNLPPGTYTVTVSDLPTGYSVSTTDPLVFTVDSADVVDTADFGAFAAADIGDLVWHDLDADGIHDLGEPVFDNVTVTVSGGGLGAPISVDTGSGALASGEYLFPDLDPGSYTVTVDTGDLPAGYASTTGGDGRSVVLQSDADRLDVDFGYATTATVGDLVYDDLNGDGDRDPGEPGIDGVTVTLSQGMTTIATVDTAGGGAYDFAGVAPGTYEVSIDTGDLPAGAVVVEGAGGYTSLVVVSADDIDTVDFGSWVPASLGDRLWDDADGDGVQDAGETDGFAGVTVTLTGPGLPPTGITDVTDASGAYGFTGLEPGTYTATLTTTDLPAGAVNTFGGSSQVTTLVSGENDLTIDFGWYVPATIGDLVWHDLNGDGAWDLGEPGIDAVTVTLDDGVSTVTQDTSNGAYDFAGLAPDTYAVSIDAVDLGAGAISTTGGFSQSSIAVVSGDDVNTADFGVRYPASIGDLVFEDLDGDGAFDVGEPGIGGITVTITGTSPGASHPGGTTAVTATSGPVGSYDFGSLTPGTYDVVVDSGDDDLPSGATATTVTTYTISVVSQDDDDTADFGFSVPASVGDRVFDDANGDGDDESGGDPGLAGVTLELRQGATTITSFTTTASGAYDFTGLAPGTYDVVVTNVPAGYGNTLGGTSQTVTLESGDDENDVDFGYVLGASIGDLVFDDLNGDGLWQVGEPGYDGVTVTLSGDASAMQDTVGGAYDFTSLTPGTYTVTVDVADLPTGVVNTLGGASRTFTVASGDDENGADFGYYAPAEIGDLVWNDLDGDGVRDVGEPGIDGVTVSISGGPTDDTAAGGSYSLSGLAPGTYVVAVDTADLPAGSVSTTGGFTQLVSVTSGQVDLTNDFGVAIPAAVGDTVFQDANGDGVQDAGELGIAGVDVTITGTSAGASHLGGFTTTTGVDGAYSVTGLLPGTYVLVVDPAGLPAGSSFSTPGGDTQSTTLVSAENDQTVDFGYVVPSTIGDRVFVDENVNGLFDAGDVGIDDVTVTLTGTSVGASHPGGTSLTTAAGGVYDFTGLDPGTYEVVVDTTDAEFVAALGTAFTSTTGGETLTVTVGFASDENDADFGFYAPASIGDRVWEDVDGDTTQNDGATGISGLDVTVTGTSPGASHPGGTTVQTGADGAYGVAGLAPGTYSVVLTTPAGDLVTTAGGANRTVSVGSGVDLDTVDFGLATPASVGDLVFDDVDGDGAFGGGDVPRAGVDVTITGPSHPTGSTVATSAGGAYDFSGLVPGTYTVAVDTGDLPAGTQSTTGGFSQTVAVRSGDDIDTVDFGDAVPASLGDRLFEDLDGDGADDGVGTEPGFANVDVTITGPGLPLAGTTVQTDADGVYGLGGLAPGTYTVTVDTGGLPVGVVNTLGGTAQVVTLGSGDVDLGLDFGWYVPATIGDLVWIDENGNGTQNIGESGVPGTEVTITGTSPGASFPSGTTVVSGALGDYDVTGLAPGTYAVELTAGVPTGHASTTGGNTRTVTVASGDTDLSVDFGLADFVTIGDRVWHDRDASGTQDLGEFDGLTGVQIELVDVSNTVVATATTDIMGGYSFPDVQPGSYTVRVVPASVPTDFVPTTPASIAVAATSGVDVLTADFGYRTTGSLGDLVWEDLDGDGVFDAGTEAGLAGVTVTLGGDDTAVTVTDGSGAYAFDDLDPGSYTVTITPPATTTVTTVGGATQSATLLSGEVDDRLDFGLAFPASIGDLIWHDLDGSGTFDVGVEAGLAGVVVELRDGGGAIVATDTTDGTGAYSFTGLLPGDHEITIDATTLPVGVVSGARYAATTVDSFSITVQSGEDVDTADVGYATTAAIEGNIFDDADASGALDVGESGLGGVTVELVDGAVVVLTTATAGDGTYSFTGVAPGSYTVRVDATTVPAGYAPTSPTSIAVAPESDERITDVDVGYARPATIGDLVWHDLDGDGVHDDATEPGLVGIDVELVDGSNVVVATETTAADGRYDFDAVDPGPYTVRVDLTSLPTGANSGAVFVSSAGLPTSLPVTVTSGDDIDTADFAFRTTATIGDLVWHDLDASGVRDGGEPGLAGVVVELLDATNTVVATSTTDPAGSYSFGGLAPGIYTVRLDRATLPVGYTSTTGNDPSTLEVVSDERRDDVDFGEALLTGGVIGDQVWDDLDGDGLRDAGEPGLDGVTVELLQGATVVDSRVSAGGGGYTFANLTPGAYTVRVDPTTLPTDYVSSTGGLSQSTTLLSGQIDRDRDFGFVAPATIGDRVWHDLDASGTQDAGEAGIGGVTVEVRDGATVVATATTDSFGDYSVDVPPGTYVVALDPTTVPDGVNSGVPMTITSAPAGPFAVVSNDAVNTADFGLATTARVGDTIFDDRNGDGDQDPGEPGLVGVDVLLADGIGGTVRVTTAAGGRYEFTGVAPGSYTVAVDPATLPIGAVATTTGSPVPVVLESDDLIDDVDLGFARPASLAGIVWTDADGSGTRGAEPLLAGIVIELLDDSDTVVGSRTTGAAGDYQFTGLLPGEYTVRPVLPAGTAPTTPDVGGDDLVDSDVLPATGRTAAITVSSGDVITGVDAGLVALGSIGDTVFADLDRDGLQDPGEPGIDGVTVTVRDGGGLVVGTDVTSGGGTYRVDVPPGAYTITMTVPAGWGVAPGADVATANVVSGTAVDDVDFPLLGARSLGGSVVYDVAGDASLDASDPGLGGVTVTATWDGPTGPVPVVTATAADGTFAFGDLPPGTYTVVVDDTDLPDGIIDPTVDPDGPIGGVDLVTDVDLSASDATAVDFGVTGTARLGDDVFVDGDGDGELDPGEPGVAGVTVTAIVTTTAGVMTYSAVTDSTGFYEFTDLPAGDYVVSIDPTTVPIGLVWAGGDRSTSLVIGGADDSVDMPLVAIVGPTAVPDSASTPPATPVDIVVLDNDRPQPGTTVSVVSHTEPSDGSLELLPGGVFRYIPDRGFVGTDTFDYTICDLDALNTHGDTSEMRAVLCSTTTVSVETPPPTVADGSNPTPGGSGTTGSGGTPSSTTGDPDLPRAGSDAWSLPRYGSFLIGLGIALWLLTRRREDADPEPARVPIPPWPEPDPRTRRR